MKRNMRRKNPAGARLCRKMTAAVCAFWMLAGAAGAEGLDNFVREKEYTAQQFADVAADAWYYENVADAYELGLMIGKGQGLFDTSSDVTAAETITIAARLHSIYLTGTESFENGDPWYQPYAEYALENGIIDDAEMPMDRPAARWQFASILAAALPAEALEEINEIADGVLPDVPETADYRDAVYSLYRAGVLVGNDVWGTFSPDREISRAEVAAIVTRMADPALRKTIRLGEIPAAEPLPEEDPDGTNTEPGAETEPGFIIEIYEEETGSGEETGTVAETETDPVTDPAADPETDPSAEPETDPSAEPEAPSEFRVEVSASDPTLGRTSDSCAVAAGESAEIRAYPGQGAVFEGWKDLDSGRIVGRKETYTFVPTADCRLEAQFRTLESWIRDPHAYDGESDS